MPLSCSCAACDRRCLTALLLKLSPCPLLVPSLALQADHRARGGPLRRLSTSAPASPAAGFREKVEIKQARAGLRNTGAGARLWGEDSSADGQLAPPLRNANTRNFKVYTSKVSGANWDSWRGDAGRQA